MCSLVLTSLHLQQERLWQQVPFDEKDFAVTYDAAARKWTVLWKWCDGTEPLRLLNTTTEYRIRPEARQEYVREVSQLITDGWLVPHDERHHGAVKGTIPLMAAVQENKGEGALDARLP